MPCMAPCPFVTSFLTESMTPCLASCMAPGYTKGRREKRRPKNSRAQTTSQKPGPARAAGGLSGDKPPARGEASQAITRTRSGHCADNAGESPERLAPLADTDERDADAEARRPLTDRAVSANPRTKRGKSRR